jgi:hypothetical protein
VSAIDNEVVEMVPDNIENDTRLLKSRPAQSEAKLAMESIKKKAAEEKAVEERDAREK